MRPMSATRASGSQSKRFTRSGWVSWVAPLAMLVIFLALLGTIVLSALLLIGVFPAG